MSTSTPSERLLARIADKLEEWADSSEYEGWSIHQVSAQRKLATEIRNAIMTNRYDQILILTSNPKTSHGAV